MLSLVLHLSKAGAYFLLTEQSASAFVDYVRNVSCVPLRFFNNWILITISHYFVIQQTQDPTHKPLSNCYITVGLIGLVLVCAMYGLTSVLDAILSISPTNAFILGGLKCISNLSDAVPLIVVVAAMYWKMEPEVHALTTEADSISGVDVELSVEGAILVDEPEEVAASFRRESFDELMQQAQANYISAAAHDLNTPLQSFYLGLELLRETGLSLAQADIVSQTAVAVDLMKLTIAHAVDAQRLSGGFQLQPQTVFTVLSSVVERVTRIVRGYGITVPVSFELAPSVCESILIDEDWLWQMLTTLIFTACQASVHEIRVTVTVRAEINNAQDIGVAADFVRGSNQDLLRTALKSPLAISTTSSSHLLFEVTTLCTDDSCCNVGVWPASSAGCPPVAGSAELGMFTVKARVQALKGNYGSRTVSVDSAVGSGAVVWFCVPYTPAVKTATPKLPVSSPVSVCGVEDSMMSSASGDAGEKRECNTNKDDCSATSEVVAACHNTCSSAPSSPMYRTPSLSSTPEEEALRQRIECAGLVAILVEDTVTIRKLMERTLLQMGFDQVHCFENGQLGLEAMVASQVDIVFSDVQMPVMGGDAMVRAFRAAEAALVLDGTRARRQLVVAVTANGAEFGDLIGAGFDSVAPKPVSKKTLLAVVEEYLNAKECCS